MRGILNIRMLSVRAALLAVLAAGLMLPSAQAQSANQNQKSEKQASRSFQGQPPSAGSKTAEEESAPTNKEQAGGPQEGIKVHGHWVIDVRNPDGKLVTHREFENAYNGLGVLANILARRSSVGFWALYLSGSGGRYYLLEEPTATFPGDSHNLTVSADGSGPFVLKGSFTPSAPDTISFVQTEVGQCDPSNAPATPCQPPPYFGITGTSQSVSFAAGQIVQVTVTITFS